MPAVEDIYESRFLSWALHIINDLTVHPATEIFDLLQSGKLYSLIKSTTSRYNKSLYPQAVMSLNNVL